MDPEKAERRKSQTLKNLRTEKTWTLKNLAIETHLLGKNWMQKNDCKTTQYNFMSIIKPREIQKFFQESLRYKKEMLKRGKLIKANKVNPFCRCKPHIIQKIKFFNLVFKLNKFSPFHRIWCIFICVDSHLQSVKDHVFKPEKAYNQELDFFFLFIF